MESEEIKFMVNAKEMAQIAYEALEEKKGEDIRVIEISEITTVADYFIIAHGNNPSQVSSLVENVEFRLSEKGYESKRIEGVKNTSWVLMDYTDVIIHIFSKEDRLFYDLERIWRDGKDITKEELQQ